MTITKRVLWVKLAGVVLLAGQFLVAGDFDPASLDSGSFLQLARRPFLQHAWARLDGTVQFKNDHRNVKLPLHLAILMHSDYLRAEFTLDHSDLYEVRQAYSDQGVSNVRITPPPQPQAPPLESLGVAAEDITFSFLYWEFVEELPGRTVRGQKCRVMRLRNPQTHAEVVVSLSAQYVGPMRVEHFKAGETQAYRWMEFTDFERHGDLYYVTAAQLRGKNWKTQVKFNNAELALTEETAPPEDLFAAGR